MRGFLHLGRHPVALKLEIQILGRAPRNTKKLRIAERSRALTLVSFVYSELGT